MPGRKIQPGDGQQSLAGFVEPVPNDRLFLGIFPDAIVQDTIAQAARRVQRQHGMHGQPLHPSRCHMTVHHLGDYPELLPERVDAALMALDRTIAPAWEIAFDRIASFRGKHKHPCVLRCPDTESGAHALWRETWAHFAAAGFTQWLQSGFTPHVTLLYGDRLLPAPMAIEPIRWTVRELVLVHSRLGMTEYHSLGRRQLSDPP
jgi:2'-5' RNA ligase